MSQEIHEVCQLVCDAGAEAVNRFMAMTGMGPEALPEYFLTSLIAEALFARGQYYVALETRVSELIRWSPRQIRRRLNSHDRLRDVDIARWKPDIVVYERAPTPEEASPLALLELKRGYISAELAEDKRTDREKALRVLEEVHCDHIILGGSLSHECRKFHKKEACKLKDRWFDAAVASQKYPDYHFGCRLLSLGSE